MCECHRGRISEIDIWIEIFLKKGGIPHLSTMKADGECSGDPASGQ